MDRDIQGFVDEWRHGDRSLAKAMAKEYVEAHRAQIAPLLEPRIREEIVAMIDGARLEGRDADVAIAEMWLLTEYEPQRISGSLNLGG